MFPSAWSSMRWAERPRRPGRAPRRFDHSRTSMFRWLKLQRLAAAGAPEYGNYVMHWYDEYDIGLKGNWAAPELDDSGWKSVDIPGGFSELGVPETPAVAWFRKRDRSARSAAGRTSVAFPRLDGAHGYGVRQRNSRSAPAHGSRTRASILGDGLLKPGRNVVAIRVLKTKPEGGFLGKPEELRLMLGDKTSIRFAGEWKGQLSVDARPPHALPIGYENWPVMPSVLYEGMLAPIAPLAITGALWYQGEQNSDRGYQYRKILPVTIADWRRLFGQGDFPFYIVSLPAFSHRSPTPIDDAMGGDARVASAHGCQRSQLLSGGHHRHRRSRQPASQRQTSRGRTARAVRLSKPLRGASSVLGADSVVGGQGARVNPIALRTRRRRSHRKRREAGRVLHRRRRPQMVLGGCTYRGQYDCSLILFRAESERGALRMAVESGGDAVQRSWLTRRSLPHGYLARHYGGTQTVLRKRKPRESINLTTNSRSPSAPAPRSSPPYRRDSV